MSLAFIAVKSQLYLCVLDLLANSLHAHSEVVHCHLGFVGFWSYRAHEHSQVFHFPSNSNSSKDLL